jgi:3-hydroxyacyl-CoA dehydrogenase / enoyl-CoA hydratase / 3-hydroxybutyryl-CoA epimerase
MINYNVDSDGIATITWDMPGRSMNVLNEASMTAYAGAIEEAIKDDKVKGIILTSAKADFIAGADLEMLLGTDTSDAAKLMDQFSQLQKMFRRQETGGKPIVAAINGTALGGGCELAIACDIRFAASSATIGLTEARIGAMPGAGGSQRLPRLIGPARALEMMYSGEPIPAEKALQWGLINGIFDLNGLDEQVMSFARLLGSRSPRTSALLKRVVYQGLDRSLEQGLELERQAITEVLASRDYAEGLAAFAERRPPIFD